MAATHTPETPAWMKVTGLGMAAMLALAACGGDDNGDEDTGEEDAPPLDEADDTDDDAEDTDADLDEDTDTDTPEAGEFSELLDEAFANMQDAETVTLEIEGDALSQYGETEDLDVDAEDQRYVIWGEIDGLVQEDNTVGDREFITYHRDDGEMLVQGTSALVHFEDEFTEDELDELEAELEDVWVEQTHPMSDGPLLAFMIDNIHNEISALAAGVEDEAEVEEEEGQVRFYHPVTEEEFIFVEHDGDWYLDELAVLETGDETLTQMSFTDWNDTDVPDLDGEEGTILTEEEFQELLYG
ncbi:hypothetical protein [Nesterenkonia alba]|uniref:hypothetical protein n=1 Tax=Nesterenkonia alba TaxID=515814 RepID=UPI0012EC29E7|nr:hypothetical protein [Nesterenkonia alba]